MLSYNSSDISTTTNNNKVGATRELNILMVALL